jgi:hypothetical protein
MCGNAATFRNVRDISPVVSVVTAAAGFMCGIAIKCFAPANRRREFAVLEHNQNSLPSHCQNDETLR